MTKGSLTRAHRISWSLSTPVLQSGQHGRYSAVFEVVEAVVPSWRLTQRLHVVVQAAPGVPLQQLETVARRGAAEARSLQLLLRVQGLEGRGQEHSHSQQQVETEQEAQSLDRGHDWGWRDVHRLTVGIQQAVIKL